MKRIHILILLNLVTFTFSGCSDDTTEQSNYVELDYGSESDDCCGVWHEEEISGVAPAQGAYYWLALLDRETLVLHGEEVYIPSGPYSNVILRMNVSYLDGLPPGQYWRAVYASNSEADVGKLENRTMAASDNIVQVASYADEACTECCTKSLRRYTAFAYKNLGNVIGASASIESRYGQLCGDLSKEAQTGVWVGIQSDIRNVTQTHFVQMGYMIKRWQSGEVDSMVYVEFRGYHNENELVFFDATVPETFPGQQVVEFPQEFQFHRYGVLVDTVIGEVKFIYNQDTIYIQPASFWLNRSVQWASWVGEIDGRETDMPGTSGNPCAISDCEYSLSDGNLPHDADFDEPDVIGVIGRDWGPDEWGIWRDPDVASDLLIWDEFPLIQPGMTLSPQTRHTSPKGSY